jgi:hypothetical protein
MVVDLYPLHASHEHDTQQVGFKIKKFFKQVYIFRK